MIRLLDWDSKFFGFPVGMIKLAIEPDWEKLTFDFKSFSSNYRLLYFITSEKLLIPQDFQKNFNGHFINQRVLYQKATGRSDIKFPAYIHEYENSELTPELVQLAYTSGSFSRFRVDQNMPNGKFKELYKIWIKNSLEKKIADRIFVSAHKNKVTGMVTCKNNNAICNIGLVAVDDPEQGKRTGRYLIQKIEEQAYNDGLVEIRVPTQANNENACVFYEKLGLTPMKITNYYHFWIK